MTVIAIPSFRRPEACAARTVALLDSLGFPGPLARVEVWLSDHDEREAYVRALPGWVMVRYGSPTLRGNRASIMRAHPGSDVLFMDDDLDGIAVLDGQKTRPATGDDFGRLLCAGFAECRYRGARLWGVSPVANHFFMKDRVSVGRSFCVGSLYGMVVPQNPGPYITAHDEKEDYERSLRAFEHDGMVVRVGWAAPRTTYYRGAGGMVDGRSVEAQEAAVAYIERRWPGWTRRNAKRNSPYPEITVNPRRVR